MIKLFEKIYSEFKNGIKNVFVTCPVPLSDELYFFKNKFTKVMYVYFNRDEYIDKNSFSIDTILKKCIIDSYIEMGVNPTCKDYLQMLEDDLRCDTLVIIDNYNIPSPSPFLRHLLCSDGNIIVCGKHFNEQVDDSVLIECNLCRENGNVKNIEKDLFLDYSFSLDVDSAICFYKKLCKKPCLYDDNPEVIYSLLLALSKDDSGKSKKLPNIGYFLQKLQVFSEKQMHDEIYISPILNASKRYISYAPYLRLQLDIIDICNGFLSDITGDLYRINEPVFEVLYKTLCNIHAYIIELDSCEREDVIHECALSLAPLVSAFEMFDVNGHFSPCRNTLKHVVIKPFYGLYPTIYEGFGLSMLRSKNVVRIYGEFQRLLLLSSNEKFKEIAKSISRNFVFVRCGFENFSDYFSVKNSSVEISNEILDADFEKILLHNEHLLARGFDNGTNRGAVRYAETVMDTLKKSKNLPELFTMLLDYSFPLSNECFTQLFKMGICNLFLDSSKICDREKGNFLLHLSLILREDDEKKSLSTIIIKLITSLTEGSYVSEKAKSKLRENVSRMFVSYIFRNINNVSVLKDSFSTTLFEKYCYDAKTSEGVVAKALYDFYINGTKPKNPDSVYPFFVRLEKEYALYKSSEFVRAVKEVFE